MQFFLTVDIFNKCFDISILFELQGPKADEIAAKLGVSKGFKPAKGWVLTHNKAKRASKMGAVLIADGE